MPKLAANRTPTYRKHRASGQAIVTLNGKDHYLGPHGTAASRREYDRLIAEWIGNGRQLAAEDDGPLVNEVIAAFVRHARSYYVKNGKETSEVQCIKSAVRPLKELYGDLDAARFGPVQLRAVRQRMIESRWCRKYVNKSVARIVKAFRFAVADGKPPAPANCLACTSRTSTRPARCGLQRFAITRRSDSARLDGSFLDSGGN